MATPPPGRGTFRASDGAPVAWADAVDAWAAAARPVLVALARQHGAWISYGELGEEVQRITGIRTTMLLHRWIGEVLRHLTDAQPAGEPMLASFVLRADGTVGSGYAADLGPDELGPEGEGVDADELAARERLACHRHFGATLPADLDGSVAGA